MKKLFNQIIKFGFVGIIATLIDYGFMVLFTEIFHIPSLISAAISFIISVVFNYVASIKWVFDVDKEKCNRNNEIIVFIVLSVIGLGINELIMYFMDRSFGVDYRISKLFATGVVMCWNFITRKIFLEGRMMEKMIDKFKKIISCKKNFLYLYSLLFTLIFFGGFCLLQYAPDTYSVFSSDPLVIAAHFGSCGRYVTQFLIFITMHILNLPHIVIYYLSYLLSLICIVISISRVFNLMSEDVKNKYLCFILSVAMIIIPFSIELFMYIEKGIMALAILLSVLAVEKVNFALKTEKFRPFVSAFIYMFIANCCYQGVVGFFVVYSLVIILKNSKSFMKFLINNVSVALVYGLSSGLNYFSIKLFFANQRLGGDRVFAESIKKIINGIKFMLVETYNILPSYFFIIICSLVMLLCIIMLLKMSSKFKYKILNVLAIFYILIISLFATIAPQFIQSTDSIWFVARSSYSMVSVISVLIWYVFTISKSDSKCSFSFSIIILCLLVVQFISFTRLTVDNYIGNYEDRVLSEKIINVINDYELSTGSKVDKISIYSDKSILYVYPWLKYSGDMNIRAYSVNWCFIKALEMYSGRSFNEVDNDVNLKKHFSNHDWNSFDKEQIIFRDNTIHISIY